MSIYPIARGIKHHHFDTVGLYAIWARAYLISINALLPLKSIKSKEDKWIQKDNDEFGAV